MPPTRTSSWKELVQQLAPDAKFGPPATADAIKKVEQQMGVDLPEPLREFLREADGFFADHGCQIIWSCADIQKQNTVFRSMPEFRELYMPFNHLLFFGEDGGGDLFAFAIHADGKIHKTSVYRWEHETDARPLVAYWLEQYLEHRLKKEE
jgi:hypothetical protein